MAEDRVHIEEALADIAGVTVDRARAEKAVATVGQALAAKKRRTLRWIVPLSLAAALLVIAGMGFALLNRPASAAEQLATTLKANEAFKGWVHMRIVDGERAPGDPETWHWNTETGALASVYSRTIFYQNPKSREFQRFDAAFGLVRSGELSPWKGASLSAESAATPLTYDDLLHRMRDELGLSVKVTQRADGGMKRFDLGPVSLPPLPETGKVPGRLDFPSSIWVDEKSGLISRVLVDGKTMTLTYGQPEIDSVYDLGAPRDAKTYDNHANARTLAVWDRIQERVAKPMPEGVSVFVSLQQGSATSGGLLLHWQGGKEWKFRNYVDIKKPEEIARLLSEAETRESADALFGRLGELIPDWEWSGDDMRAICVPYRERTRLPDAGTVMYTGAAAEAVRNSHSPTWRLFPVDVLTSRYGVDNHLDLVKPEDRPGEIALHVLGYETPDVIRLDSFYWIDPEHADRPVSYVENSYYDKDKEALSPQVQFTIRTEFDSYAVLPAPDGRTVPTHWVRTSANLFPNKDGVATAPTREKWTFRFFPGKVLGPLPQVAESRP